MTFSDLFAFAEKIKTIAWLFSIALPIEASQDVAVGRSRGAIQQGILPASRFLQIASATERSLVE